MYWFLAKRIPFAPFPFAQLPLLRRQLLAGIHTYTEGVHNEPEVEQYQQASINAHSKEQQTPRNNHSKVGYSTGMLEFKTNRCLKQMNGIPKPDCGCSPILEEVLPKSIEWCVKEFIMLILTRSSLS
ncbi:hypothetical protein HOY82DRAFT_534600 [Tuber indicum]|nr:hypothetical protein HOY82DRAFT_534600 [Tuber indicum]